MTPVVRAHGLRKQYGELTAVDGIDLEVEPGEVFGLIGPDGAGKTTTFKILAGVLEPTSGEVEVLGRAPRTARFGIGYLTQPFSLYLDLSIDENLRYSAGLREVPPAEFEERRSRYLRLMSLERFADRLAGHLSGGMKQKLALCCALVAEPQLLLLDEPTTGVDPVSRRDFWDTLLALSTEGMTVIAATPYLDEAERCHRVGLMREGRIQQADTPGGLRASLGMTRLEVHTTDLEHAEEALQDVSGIADVQRFGDRLDVMARNAAQGEAAVRQALAARGLAVTTLRRSSPTLENAFVTMLRSEGREEAVPPFPRSTARPGPSPSGATTAPSPSPGPAGTPSSLRSVPGIAAAPPLSAAAPGPSPSAEAAAAPPSRDSSSGAAPPAPPLPGAPAAPEAPSSAAAIGAYDLHKRFGSFEAVKGVSFEVRHGEIYGLLGANGAGKTTAIKMLCGLMDPSAGEVRLLGQTRDLRSGSLRRQIGYMSQKFSLYDDLTIHENLQFYAGVYGVPPAWRERRERWVLEMSGLAENAGMITGRLPGGWKQRVAFGAAIMHEPRAVFLDEPTSGVDPLARRQFWRLIHDLADDGVAVLVTTHYLEEAEQCNRLGFMAEGELIAQGSPGEVKRQMREQLLEVETDQPQRALALLNARFGPGRVSLFGNWLHVMAEDRSTAMEQIRAALAGGGIELRRMDAIEPSLEDVFIHLIEQRREKANGAAT